MVKQLIAESGAGRRLALNRDRISVDLFPQRSVIKQDYPPPNDLSRFTEAILNATHISRNISDIRAHGYNVEFLFTQTEYPTVYEYIAKKVLTGFRAPDGNIVGAMVQFRFCDADGQVWNIDLQPRLRKDDATAGYCSVNLHLPSPPDVSNTVILIAAVYEKAKLSRFTEAILNAFIAERKEGRELRLRMSDSTVISRNVDASTLLDSTENVYQNAVTLGEITLVNMQVYESVDMIGALTQRSHASRDLWNVDFDQRKVAVLLGLCLASDRYSRSQDSPAERAVVVGDETWVTGSLPTDLLVQLALQKPYFDVASSPAVPDFVRDLHEVPNEADEEG